MKVEPTPLERDVFIFTLDDVLRVFRSVKKKAIRAGLIGASLAICFTLVCSPKYEAKATFKEGIEKNQTISFSGLGSLVGVGGTIPTQAAVLMKSYQVLRPVVEKNGLQANLPRPPYVVIAIKNVRDHICTLFGILLNDSDEFRFEDVCFEGVEKNIALEFEDATHYSIFEGKRKIGVGELGVPTRLPDVYFTVASAPKRLQKKKMYPVSFSSWIEESEKLRKEIAISPDKMNRAIYELSFFHRNRFLAVNILNELMNQYRVYLKRDHDQIAAEQISYLEQRQNQIFDTMAETLDAHAEYLKDLVVKTGFIGLEEELSNFYGPHEKLVTNLLQIDLELSRLAQSKDTQLLLGSDPFYQEIQVLKRELQELQQQRDLIEVTLPQSSVSSSWGQRADEIAAIRNQKEQLEELLADFSLGKMGSLPDEFEWAKSVQRGIQLSDFKTYLSNQIRLLNVRENLISERLAHPGIMTSEFDGIDLSTSRMLFVEYNKKLDASEVHIRNLMNIKNNVLDPEFEIGSLSTVLNDSVSLELIGRASKINAQLKDERYRSLKEGERWSEEIALERKILSSHIEQILKVEEVNALLLKEKIDALQKASLDCINQKISVLHETIESNLVDRKRILLKEKEMLSKKIEELRVMASDIPEKWKKNQMLELKTELGTKIMSATTELVETKTIGSHLHHVESKPLDPAVIPFLPKPPRVLEMGGLGGFFGLFGVLFAALFKTMRTGFPTTGRKLQMLGLPFSGLLSLFCDGPEVELVSGSDLDTLRKLSLFFNEDVKVATLVGGKGPDYSFALAQNLARSGKSTCLIRANFSTKFSAANRSGLVQWVENKLEEFPIRRGEGFDWIPSGGFTPFGAEILQSKRFQELLKQCCKSYDLVLLWTTSAIDSPEVEIALKYSDRAVATVNGELTEQLTPLIDWAYHEGKYRLTFVSVE